MSLHAIQEQASTKMESSIAALKSGLTKVRTGRANPALLDTVHVDYYGAMLPLSQVANLSLIDARTIGIQPWEKSMAAKIEKAIRESDLGLNPASMGELIRVPMPMVKKLVKDKLASEDEQKRSEADIQKLTDRHIADVDRLVAAKEQDIMAV